jgi:hypothetical protein
MELLIEGIARIWKRLVPKPTRREDNVRDRWIEANDGD